MRSVLGNLGRYQFTINASPIHMAYITASEECFICYSYIGKHYEECCRDENGHENMLTGWKAGFQTPKKNTVYGGSSSQLNKSLLVFLRMCWGCDFLPSVLKYGKVMLIRSLLKKKKKKWPHKSRFTLIRFFFPSLSGFLKNFFKDLIPEQY